MKIGILTAMEKEASAIVEAIPQKLKAGLLTCNCGIGKVNAAIKAAEMISLNKPDFIMSVGCAGSLGHMAPGDVLIADRVAYHDVWCGSDVGAGKVQGMPRYFNADEGLLSAARKLAASVPEGGASFCIGLLVTGDQFYISGEEDARIRELYPSALAADMESAAIAQACHIYGVPFLSARIISDTHTSSEIQQDTYANLWGSDMSHYVNFVSGLLEAICRNSI